MGALMRWWSRLRDPFVATVVGLCLALAGILFVAFVPIVPHSFAYEFAEISPGKTLTLPVGSWVTGSWTAQRGDTLKFVVAPSGGSPVYQDTGTSGMFSFLAIQATYDFHATYANSNHIVFFDNMFLNGTFTAPVLWS